MFLDSYTLPITYSLFVCTQFMNAVIGLQNTNHIYSSFKLGTPSMTMVAMFELNNIVYHRTATILSNLWNLTHWHEQQWQCAKTLRRFWHVEMLLIHT